MTHRSRPVVLFLAALLLAMAFASPSSTAGAPKQAGQFKGRLPNHYRTVVTEDQRQEIYAIQAQYAPELRRLKERLKALTTERNARIEAILTEQQRKQIADLKQAAKEKRKKAKRR